MTLSLPMLVKLATPKPGYMTTRLPTKSAQTNAALIAFITKAKEGKGADDASR